MTQIKIMLMLFLAIISCNEKTNNIDLFETEIENGKISGFTENYVRVQTKYDPILVNETKKIRLSAINLEGFVEVEEI